MKTIKLTTRNQNEFIDPTEDQIIQAVGELKISDPEHPNCWIELGFESDFGWSTISLDAYESGLIIYSEWEDQDDDDPKVELRFNSDSRETIGLFNKLNDEKTEELKQLITKRSTE